jgi:hypothetical protein
MLLTTLLPTFAHAVIILGAPLGVVLIPDRKRLALAQDLDNFATAGERQRSICARAALWHVQQRTTGWLIGAALLVLALGRFWVLYPGGVIDWAAGAARIGVGFAEQIVAAPPETARAGDRSR